MVRLTFEFADYDLPDDDEIEAINDAAADHSRGAADARHRLGHQDVVWIQR